MLRGWLDWIDTAENFCFWFSEDGGQTWSEPEKVPALPDGRAVNTDVAPNMLIEGDTVRFVFYIDGRWALSHGGNHLALQPCGPSIYRAVVFSAGMDGVGPLLRGIADAGGQRRPGGLFSLPPPGYSIPL